MFFASFWASHGGCGGGADGPPPAMTARPQPAGWRSSPNVRHVRLARGGVCLCCWGVALSHQCGGREQGGRQNPIPPPPLLPSPLSLPPRPPLSSPSTSSTRCCTTTHAWPSCCPWRSRARPRLGERPFTFFAHVSCPRSARNVVALCLGTRCVDKILEGFTPRPSVMHDLTEGAGAWSAPSSGRATVRERPSKPYFSPPSQAGTAPVARPFDVPFRRRIRAPPGGYAAALRQRRPSVRPVEPRLATLAAPTEHRVNPPALLNTTTLGASVGG